MRTGSTTATPRCVGNQSRPSAPRAPEGWKPPTPSRLRSPSARPSTRGETCSASPRITASSSAFSTRTIPARAVFIQSAPRSSSRRPKTMGSGSPCSAETLSNAPSRSRASPPTARADPQHARPVDVESPDSVGGQPVSRGERRERAVAVAAQPSVGAAEPERAVEAFGEGDDEPVRQPIGCDGLEARAGPPGEALSARPHAALPIGEEAEYDVARQPVGSGVRRESPVGESGGTTPVRPDPQRAVGVFGEGEHALGGQPVGRRERLDIAIVKAGEAAARGEPDTPRPVFEHGVDDVARQPLLRPDRAGTPAP